MVWTSSPCYRTLKNNENEMIISIIYLICVFYVLRWSINDSIEFDYINTENYIRKIVREEYNKKIRLEKLKEINEIMK